MGIQNLDALYFMGIVWFSQIDRDKGFSWLYKLILKVGLFNFRYYGYLMAKGLPIKLQAIADTSASCLGIVLNSVVAIHTRSPSILLPYSSLKFSAVSKEVNNERTCLNMAINVLGQTSLITSFIKFDPLLYKDNVSNYRKYFHKLE